MAIRATKALRDAVRDTLITTLSPVVPDPVVYSPGFCQCTIDGRPTPLAGDTFIAVHPGGWSNTARDHFDERHGVNVTITVRLSESPPDREVAMIDLNESLEDLAQRVANDIHAARYTIMATANAALESGINGFVEPIQFRDCGPPTYRYGDWFRNEVNTTEAIAISRTLRFEWARRIVKTSP